MSAVAHFFVVVGGSKIHERLAHFFIDIYSKSQNPKLLTVKMICDGLGITLAEFFDTPAFNSLEQEIK